MNFRIRMAIYTKQNKTKQNKTNIDLWNKIESPEITHVPMGTLFLTKKARKYNGSKIASSISGSEETGQLCAKE